jgi:hypothetical protein
VAGPYEHGNEPLGSVKGGVLTSRLLAIQGLCSMGVS